MKIHQPAYSNHEFENILGKYILSLLVLLFPASLSCQITFEKLVGHTWEAEYCHSVLQTIDSGYIICGSSGTIPSVNEDVYIIKTDQFGNLLWDKNYGVPPGNETGYSISKTSDDGYIISAEYYNSVDDVMKSYLLRINSEGDTLWTKYYDEMGDNNARCALETFDKGIIFCGTLHTPSGRDGFVTKTDDSGEILWSKSYSETVDTWFYNMKQTADSGYIICGGIEIAPGLDDFYIVKTDQSGDTLWSRNYGGPGYDAAYSIVENIDGTYVIAGLSWNTVAPNYFDVFLIKLNHNGDTSWLKRYGGYWWNDGYFVDRTSDDGYIVCGGTRTCESCKDDMYLLKVDSAGNELWTETFGILDYDVATCVHETNDAGFILCGNSTGHATSHDAIYLIKTDSEGLLTGINNEIKDDQAENIIFPNPNHGNFKINLPVGRSELQIINQQGQSVYTQNFKREILDSPVQIELAKLPAGLYMLRIIQDTQVVRLEKLIIY